MVVHHPHLAWFEGGHVEQSNSAGFRACHGGEFCSHDHFRHRDGIEVWQESQSGSVLSCRWRGIAADCCADFGLDRMTLPESG